MEEWSEPSQWLILATPLGIKVGYRSFPGSFHVTVHTLQPVHVAFLGESALVGHVINVLSLNIFLSIFGIGMPAGSHLPVGLGVLVGLVGTRSPGMWLTQTA